MGELSAPSGAARASLDTADLLRRVPLLHSLPGSELEELASRATRVEVDEGEILVRQGEPGHALYIVAEGQVRVVSDVPDERLLLSRLGPGEFFGEISLLSGEPRNAAVVADRASALIVLERAAFQELLARRPETRAAIGELAARRAGSPGARFQNEAYSLLALSASQPRVTIGSAPDNDVVLDAVGVSSHHAVLAREGAELLVEAVEDGLVYVNRRPVTSAPVVDGDVITLGSRRLFLLDGVLKLFEQSRGVRVQAQQIVRVARSGQTILDHINVEIFPGELVAVVGSSGAGKTTLIHALIGLDTVTSGTILYDGVDLASDMEPFRRILGYVPQYDIVHAELTVRDSLRFTGRLRLAATSEDELEARIDTLLATLRLTHRAETLVGQLSGGQRKRVSVAAELLSDPGIVYLDEPTSGLDPGLDEQLMLQLRELADEGRTVVLTTHATRNIRVCDRVVILHGGCLAYAGTPAEALSHFGVEDFAEIYGRLEEQTGAEAAALFTASSASPAPAVFPAPPQAAPAARRERVSPVRQFLPLVERDLKVLWRDRVNMVLRLLGAPVLALLQVSTFDSTVFAVDRVDGGNAHLGLTLLYLSSAICLFLSAFTSANVLTREASIFRRERLVGLSVPAYMASKVAVLSAFALIQGVLFVGVLALKIDFPGPNPATVIQLMGALVLVSLAGTTLGLLISALSPNADRAAILVVLALIPQLIFAGSTVPRSEMSPVSKAISEITVTKWALELTGGLAGLDERFDTQAIIAISAGEGSLIEVEVPHQPFANAFIAPLSWRWTALAGFSIVFLSATFVALRWPPRRT